MKTKQPVKNQIIIYIAKQPGKHVSQIAKDIDVTYSHIVKEMNKLEVEGYVVSKKTGRERLIHPTQKCMEMAPHCEIVARL